MEKVYYALTNVNFLFLAYLIVTSIFFWISSSHNSTEHKDVNVNTNQFVLPRTQSRVAVFDIHIESAGSNVYMKAASDIYTEIGSVQSYVYKNDFAYKLYLPSDGSIFDNTAGTFSQGLTVQPNSIIAICIIFNYVETIFGDEETKKVRGYIQSININNTKIY